MLSSNTVYAAMFVASLIPAANAIPELVKDSETKLFPVVSDFRIDVVQRGHDFVRVIPIGVKNRSCKFISLDGYASQAGVSLETTINFENDPTPGNTRPEGKQSFGVWNFSLKDLPNADSVFAIAEHDCGLWSVRTKIGPFNIGEPIL